MKKQEKSIGELLIHAGFLTQDRLMEALEDQKQSGEPIGKILKRKGYVKEEDIIAVLKGALVLVFKIAGEAFAVEIVYSREILKPMKITPIHAVPDYMLGIISIRGQVIPVISLRRRIFGK